MNNMRLAVLIFVGLLNNPLCAISHRVVPSEKINALMALAVQENKVELVQKLIEEHRVDINQNNPYGFPSFTYLMKASFNGCLQIVTLLVEHGADISIKEKVSGFTALEFAFKYEKHEIVAYLGMVHLWDFIEKNNRAGVRLMLEKFGADVDGERPYPRQKYAMTPLMMAAAKGHLDMVKLLISYGANINREDGVYGTAFDYALGYKKRDVIKYLGLVMLSDAVDTNNLAMAKRIIEKASPDLDKRGLYSQEKSVTLLMKAASKGYLSMVKLLVTNGARTGIEDDSGKRAIEYAFIAKQREVVAYLATVTK